MSKKIEFTQAELNIVISVLANTTYKLGDAKLVLPIVERLISNVEPPKEEVKLTDKKTTKLVN